ncbi:MAG: acyltransferase family protein [Alphaproteobacteria bacterium]
MTYNSIQILRCVAVISVLILHSHTAIPREIFFFPFFSQFGWVGVNLFFVISGFIIADRIEYERSLRRYLAKRYARVFPLYLILTTVAVLLSSGLDLATFTLERTDSGAPYDPETLPYLLKSIFIIPQDEWPVLSVGWSLEYEIVFYMTFGIAYFAGGRSAALFAMLVLTLAGILFTDLTRPVLDPVFTYFLMGCLAREAVARDLRAVIRSAPVVFVLGGTAATLHLYKAVDLSSLGFTVVAALAFAALLIWMVELERTEKAFQHRNIFTLIGDMSFSLYLVHWIIMPLSQSLTTGVSFSDTGAEIVRLVAIMMSLLASWTVWKYVETPINTRRRDVLDSR